MRPVRPRPPRMVTRAALFRAVAVVVKGDTAPHLYTIYVDGALRIFPTIICTGRFSRISTTAMTFSPRRSPPFSLPVPASASTIRPTRCCAACPGLTGSTPPMWSALRSSRRHLTKSRAYANAATAERAGDDRRAGDSASRRRQIDLSAAFPPVESSNSVLPRTGSIRSGR